MDENNVQTSRCGIIDLATTSTHDPGEAPLVYFGAGFMEMTRRENDNWRALA